VIAGVVIAGVALSVSVSSFQAASRAGGFVIVFWGAFFLGVAIALRSLFRTTGSIAADAAHKQATADLEEWESRVTSLKIALGDEWTEAAARLRAEHGKSLPDWRIAQLLRDENAAREAARLATFRRNAAVAYAPVVSELKATMTPLRWERHRRLTTGLDRVTRLEQWQLMHPGTAPPDGLDPGRTPVAEDWQVAADMRPLRLDPLGNPVEDAPPV
jgi:hypothetical protein